MVENPRCRLKTMCRICIFVDFRPVMIRPHNRPTSVLNSHGSEIRNYSGWLVTDWHNFLVCAKMIPIWLFEGIISILWANSWSKFAIVEDVNGSLGSKFYSYGRRRSNNFRLVMKYSFILELVEIMRNNRVNRLIGLRMISILWLIRFRNPIRRNTEFIATNGAAVLWKCFTSYSKTCAMRTFVVNL